MFAFGNEEFIFIILSAFFLGVAFTVLCVNLQSRSKKKPRLGRFELAPAGIPINDRFFDYKIQAYVKMKRTSDHFIQSLTKELHAENLQTTTAWQPQIIILNTPRLLHHDLAQSLTYAPCWESIGLAGQSLIHAWVTEAKLDYSAEEMFKKCFYWYWIVQDIAVHAIQNFRLLPTVNFFGMEMLAHKIAIAYFILSGQEDDLLEFLVQCQKLAQYFLADLNIHEYSTDTEDIHRHIILSPRKKGYFQFALVKSAYDMIHGRNIQNILDVAR